MQIEINRKSLKFMSDLYDMVYLHTMFHHGWKNKPSTIVVGSSYPLVAINDSSWDDMVNLSSHSQDLYYDYLALKRLLNRVSIINNPFKQCFLVLGYYAMFHDVSLSKRDSVERCKKVFYPIYHDCHHLRDIKKINSKNYDIPNSKKIEIINFIKGSVTSEKVYFASWCGRTTLWKNSSDECIRDKKWIDLPDHYKNYYAQYRTNSHNKLLKYRETFEENKKIFKNIVDMLKIYNISLIVIIPPFSMNYLSNIDDKHKIALLEVMRELSIYDCFIDMNEYHLFKDEDFWDPDHLNSQGGKKITKILRSII